MAESIKALFATAEVAPFSKVGGLADVAGSLPKALTKRGHDVRLVAPSHGDPQRDGFRQIASFSVSSAGHSGEATVWEGALSGGVPIYLIGEPTFFGPSYRVYGLDNDLKRYLFFSKAVLEMCKALGWQPDIFHCNDWHTAAIPFGLRNRAWGEGFYRGSASIITIHNLRYRGPDEMSDLLLQGIFYADVVSTVSKTYAREILSQEYGEGLQDILRLRESDLYGIINGLDYEEFNPATDPALAANYDINSLDNRGLNKRALQEKAGLPQEPGVPLIGMVSRLTEQKGFDLLEGILERKLGQDDFQLVVLGTGDERYQEFLTRLSQRYPQKVAAIMAFAPALAQLIYGGSDMFLMPSRYEPCGLGQLISMRYGGVPIVRATGGLVDTVADCSADLRVGTGFVFEEYSGDALSRVIDRALEGYRRPELWRGIIIRCISKDFSWDASAKEYEDLYTRAQNKIGK